MRAFDASVLAVALGDGGPEGRRTRALLREAGDGAVPDCADAETATVLRRWWLTGGLDDRRPAAALRDLTDLPFARFPARPFLPRVYELRANVGAYDAVYVALAESLRCNLVTADRRLTATPGLRCPVSLAQPPGR